MVQRIFDMNTKLGTDAKNEFEKDFFQLINNCFWKEYGECKEVQIY